MAITTKPEHRKLGIVWYDPELKDNPSTHVLLVGVGRFDNEGESLPPLRSTTAAARAVAAWFLNGARGDPDGFSNPRRPLGSLAILLSELDDGKASVVEGAEVPRARFCNVKTALRAWIDRAEASEKCAEASEKSTAILAMFSHGQAERRRTAVLFEDFGSDLDDARAGATEAEQLIDALSTRAPDEKLAVFDCCRTKVDLGLPNQGDIGRPLIGDVPSPLRPRPQVMMSTQYDGESYGGKEGRPTLFATALLHALRGCAADIDDWTVNSRRLGEITERILGLWRQGDEPLQVPDTQDNKAIVLAQLPESERTTVFLWLTGGQNVNQTTFTVYEGEAGQEKQVFQSVGTGGPQPFLAIPVTTGKSYRLVASGPDGQVIGEDRRPLRPPVAFRPLPPDGLPPLVQAKRTMSAGKGAPVNITLERTSGTPDATVISFEPALTEADVAGALEPSAGVDFDVVLDALQQKQRQQQQQQQQHQQQQWGQWGQKQLPAQETAVRGFDVLPDAEAADGARLQPGSWVVKLSRPGLPVETRRVEVEAGDTLHVTLAGRQSPHEWLMGAITAGVIPRDLRIAEGPDLEPPELRVTSKEPHDLVVTDVKADARFVRYCLHDRKTQRFPYDEPVWAEISFTDAAGKPWKERCFLPLLGDIARFAFTSRGGEIDPWEVELLMDATPPRRASHLVPYVRSRRWGPLLAFLGGRNFPAAGATLRALDGEMLREAVAGKLANPLAAICGALVAEATDQTEALGIPDDWLVNLCNLFPTLPDGAVILARRRLRQGHKPNKLLETALARGIPVTSLALDWLSQMLALTKHPRAPELRGVAMSADPARVFTVLQLPADASAPNP